jgi:hypothetical protein
LHGLNIGKDYTMDLIEINAPKLTQSQIDAMVDVVDADPSKDNLTVYEYTHPSGIAARVWKFCGEIEVAEVNYSVGEKIALSGKFDQRFDLASLNRRFGLYVRDCAELHIKNKK